MKKILAIGHSFVLAQNRDVLRALHTGKKAEVTVMAPRFFHGDLRDIDLEAEPTGSSMRVVPIDCYLTGKIHFFAYNIFQIEKVLKEERFDAVYLWEEPYIVSGFTLAHVFHKHGLPYFFYCCQNIHKKYPWPFSFFEHTAQSHAAGMFACGVTVKEVLNVKGCANTDVLPFFVSLDRFRPFDTSEKQAALARLHLDGTFTIGFMGRLVEEKGIALFLNVAEEILSRHSCNIIVIGSGPMDKTVNNWMATRKNARLLKLRHDEVPQVLPAMDVLLSPSQTRSHWKEQFGRMIVEAMAAGVPVVGSDSGEIPYVIGDAGKIVPESDLPEWVKVVENILSMPELRESLKERGKHRAKNFSADTVANSLYDFIAAALRWK